MANNSLADSLAYSPYCELHPLELLGIEPEQEFTELAELAADMCGTQMSLITLLGKKWQYHKARVGLQTARIPRTDSFCHHAVQQDSVFIVKDATRDPVFMRNPLVTGAPWIRFYAGAPLYSPTGMKVGALCVIDTVPRELRSTQVRDLAILAKQVNGCFELRAMRRRAGKVDHSTSFFELLDDVPSSCETGTPNLSPITTVTPKL